MGFSRNPEFEAMNNLDRMNRGEQIRETADLLLPHHEKFAAVLDKIAIDPDDFEELYGAENIAADKAKLADREAKIAESDMKKLAGMDDFTYGDVSKLADILEYQTIRGLNTGNWMPYCRAIKTSRFDDVMNGVDSIVEFTPPGQVGHLGLGVDVTFSQNIDGKIARIKDEIDTFDGKGNSLGQVKYFSSQNTGITGRLRGLPRVVSAMDIGVIEDLCKSKDLTDHVAKHAMIVEMQEQLKLFTEYAGDTGSDAYTNLHRASSFVDTISTHLDSAEKLKRSEYTKNNKAQSALTKSLRVFS